MTKNRIGEEGAPPSRTQRYYQKDNYWYYTTREGVSIGPFDTLADAETGVRDFIDYIDNAEASEIETLERYRNEMA